MSAPDPLSPREAIAGLVHRYADAVVRRDADQWTACWAPDSRWHLSPSRSVEGREAIAALWVSAMATFTAVVQMVNNGEVHVEGDTASGRWYITERFRRMNGDAGMLLAHYDDVYIAIDGAWLFASRALVVHYQGPPDLSAPFLNDVTREH